MLLAPDDTKATQTADPNRKPPAIVTHKKKIKLRRARVCGCDGRAREGAGRGRDLRFQDSGGHFGGF